MRALIINHKWGASTARKNEKVIGLRERRIDRWSVTRVNYRWQGRGVLTSQQAATCARFHNLSGPAATKFYVAGLPIRVIAEILAWSEDQVERIIRRYVARAAELRQVLERAKGIEPSYAAWEAAVLPLNYARARRP